MNEIWKDVVIGVAIFVLVPLLGVVFCKYSSWLYRKFNP